MRVRLLLDDIYTSSKLDSILAALAAHPNIEVRLYNPLTQRTARVLNLLTDFTRVNRRMHNKSFTVDNQVTVVGGRNIGNEYFAAGSGLAFADLDVIAVGAAVSAVSKQFDVYWNSASAYPVERIVGAAPPDSAAKLMALFGSTRTDPKSTTYIDAVHGSRVIADLLDRKLDFEWVTTRLLYDDPAKTLDTEADSSILLFPELVRVVGPAEKSLEPRLAVFRPRR